MTRPYTSRGPHVRARSYRLAVPPAVVRLPGIAALRDVLHLTGREPGEAERERVLRRAQHAATSPEALARVGTVLDTYVTAGPVPGCGVGLSIVVTAAPAQGTSRHVPPRVAFETAGDARSLTVGGEPAICVASPGPSARSPSAGAGRVLRAKTILSCVPGDDDTVISFALLVAQLDGAASPEVSDIETEAVADALVELFDAMMTTVRWLDEQGRVITDRPTT